MTDVVVAWNRAVELADRLDAAARRGRVPARTVPAAWALLSWR